MTESRIAFVEGFQFSFQQQDPERPPRRVGSRWVVRDWACQVEYRDEWSIFTLHEYNDGVFEPSGIQGVFSDFAGAAAAEVGIRWLQRRLADAERRNRRLRDIGLAALGVVILLALAVVSFR
jgi:hypothetical protein